MHLLDLVAQGLAEPVETASGQRLPDATRFQAAVRDCPIRYVLEDKLARCATEMAFAEGDRLSSCLDLIRVPARTLWIEWTDAARRLESLAIATGSRHDATAIKRAGVWVTAAPDGRSGTLRSFWSSRHNIAYCSPLSVEFDLDSLPDGDRAREPAIGPRGARVTAPAEFGLDLLLEHLTFRFDEEWASYYQAACEDDNIRHAVLRANLGACAFDPPMVFAFFLMLSARGALPRHTVSSARLNRARQRVGRAPLLEHVVVSAPLYSKDAHAATGDLAERRRPRLHHVCGHIVRRGSTVFWRVPHLRGNARQGQFRTRTVELSFAQQMA